VGGFHAYLRAVTSPPTAHPVARFLLFERAYPDSVAACVLGHRFLRKEFWLVGWLRHAGRRRIG
jgi:hypothetical protein